MRPKNNFTRALAIIGLVTVLGYAIAATIGGSILLDNAVHAQQQGTVPGQSLGGASDAEIWRALRQGNAGTISLPDRKAAVLIQSEGEAWRAIRNGPLSTYGAWGLLGIVVLLALFFVVRGRVKIDSGFSGNKIERFNGLERFAHWLMATTFIVLGLTGLNLLYGRYVIKPVIGPDAFALISEWGKIGHNYLAFGFMLGVVLAFVLWVSHNIPNKHDLVWLSKGGGLFVKGSHPPSKKFNAGQKLIFWIVVIGGASISLSGIMLMFPFEFSMFAGTFEIVNVFGFNLPTELTPMQEQQLAQIWHSIIGLFLIIVIIAHIYIGSIGMEGAFDAMGTGQVDENWAREHHNIWVAELKGEPVQSGHGGHDDKPSGSAPAE